MKNASFFSTAILLLSTLFISQTAQAQWVNGTSIYTADFSKKVGIGVDNPSFELEVKGSIGLRSSSNAFLGSLSDDGSGNLRMISYSSPFIGSVPKNLLLNPSPLFGRSGNVGIGSSSPAEAKLVVKGDIGHTVAMFGQGRAGISLVRDWSTVGFNAYYSGTAWTAMSTGYGALMGCDPSTGRIEIIQNGYASGNNPVSQSYPLIIEPTGNVGIGGGMATAKLTVVSYQAGNADNTMTLSNPAIGPNESHIHWGTRGDWYIRSAADNGVVVIQDNAGGVGIGTSNVAGYKLAVAGKVVCEELKVKLQGNWPDYVFADGYNLKSLEEVEAHIQAKNHLPGIPAAAEIEKDGIEVGNMQQKMMEKIEELTLYVIEINKENKALKQRVEQLENKQ